MAQFPIKNALIQGTLDGTPASGTVDLSALTLTVPISSLRIGTSVQAYDADLTTWAGVTPAAGITTFLTTPSGANLATALTSALPASKGGTGLTALGTGVSTALGIANNTAGGYSPIDGVATLSNKTFTAPKFASGGFIADANGNELIIFTTTASAVNEVTFANAATGGMPTLSATGGDTNIHLKLTPKGTGGTTHTAGTRANPTIRFDTANNSGGQNEIGICNYFQNVGSLCYNGNSNFEWGAGGVILKNSAGLNRINCETSQLLVSSTLALDWSGGLPILYSSGTEIARAASTGFTLAGALIGTPQSLSGAGAVNVTTTTTAFTATAPAHALTLANGTAGQIKTVCMVATSGAGTGVLTPTTKTGYTTITFNAAGDSVMLQYFTTAGWCIIGSRGVAIA